MARSDTQSIHSVVVGLSVLLVAVVSVVFLMNESRASWGLISHVTEFDAPVMLSEVPERGLEILAYSPNEPQAMYLYYQYAGHSSEPRTMVPAGKNWYRGYIQVPEYGGEISYYVQAAYFNKYFSYPEDLSSPLIVMVEDDISFEERHPYLALTQKDIEEMLPADYQRGDALRQNKVELEFYLTPGQYRTVNQATIATGNKNRSKALVNMASWYIEWLPQENQPETLAQPKQFVKGTAKRFGHARHRYYVTVDDERLLMYALSLTGKTTMTSALHEIAYQYAYHKDALY